MKKLWDEKNGELLFYNIYCLRKELEHIDSEIKSYTYDMVVKKTKLKNKATKKALMQDLLTGKVRVKTTSTNTEVAVG